VLAAVSADSETAYEIESAHAGRVVPPAEPATLADAIVALRDDPAGTEAFAAGGREYAETKLEREKALRDYDTFIERLLAAGAERRL